MPAGWASGYPPRRNGRRREAGPSNSQGGNCNRYPWGDLLDPERTNLWSSGIRRTVPVAAYPKGATPNGIFQMTGNVWEWLDDPLETIPCSAR